MSSNTNSLLLLMGTNTFDLTVFLCAPLEGLSLRTPILSAYIIPRFLLLLLAARGAAERIHSVCCCSSNVSQLF
jgi:hypothetical protein